uniref:Radial spoke head protein 3 homolog B n=1 Tax=Toxoplasma gondii (strain ATCC 50861 / VEG) TaxID=432359 RepID=A0A0F7UWG4_TOXGV|nr:TPA: Radial spoke head protein 3 homolog B [Toxoplasma gondii VEG]
MTQNAGNGDFLAIPAPGIGLHAYITFHLFSVSDVLRLAQVFGDEELFDFADEVSPLVEVLVWKTLEEVQSELVHEGELEEMAAYREACEQRCRARLDREAQAERLEWQRVENMRKLIEFNERRIEEEGLLIRKLLAVEAAERTPFYPLVEGCLDGLQAQGAFIEDNTVAVQTVAMLQLNKDVKARLAQLVVRPLETGTE